MRGTINFYNANCAVEELWVHFFVIMPLAISLILTILHKTQKKWIEYIKVITPYMNNPQIPPKQPSLVKRLVKQVRDN